MYGFAFHEGQKNMNVSCSMTAKPFTMRYTLPFDNNKNATESQRCVNVGAADIRTIDAAFLKIPSSGDGEFSPMEP